MSEKGKEFFDDCGNSLIVAKKIFDTVGRKDRQTSRYTQSQYNFPPYFYQFITFFL